RLKVPVELWKTLRSTNVIESAFSIVRVVCRNVKRWRPGNQIERWVGSGLVVAEKQFRRIEMGIGPYPASWPHSRPISRSPRRPLGSPEGKIMVRRAVPNFNGQTDIFLHREPLCFLCPSCKRQNGTLDPRTRPGHCSRCGQWLASTTSDVLSDTPALR